ncbi:hypothetical protein LCGC14_1529090 [marine sediment metagenome]|uniref:Uncharacterized protein n=1 Tax=marine sediment metagenome TaxID=412755 RepID=A0A0F9LC00_9ZZZZ
MDAKQAKEIQQTEEQKKRDLIESQKVLEADKLKKLADQKEKEKQESQQARADLKARFPKAPGNVYMKCWKCKKQIDMDRSELIEKGNARLFRVIECQCGYFNVEFIAPTQAKILSRFDALLEKMVSR